MWEIAYINVKQMIVKFAGEKIHLKQKDRSFAKNTSLSGQIVLGGVYMLSGLINIVMFAKRNI